MRVLMLIWISIGLLAYGAVRAGSGSDPMASPCDAERDRCRSGCFDRYAERDAAAHARCKEECNRAWVACQARVR